MFDVPVPEDSPASLFYDNKAVYQNTAIPDSTIRKKQHSISCHRCKEAVAANTIRVAKQGTDKNLVDVFTKILTAARRIFLLKCFTY